MTWTPFGDLQDGVPGQASNQVRTNNRGRRIYRYGHVCRRMHTLTIICCESLEAVNEQNDYPDRRAVSAVGAI